MDCDMDLRGCKDTTSSIKIEMGLVQQSDVVGANKTGTSCVL